jgi:hypothetical protein
VAPQADQWPPPFPPRTATRRRPPPPSSAAPCSTWNTPPAAACSLRPHLVPRGTSPRRVLAPAPTLLHVERRRPSRRAPPPAAILPAACRHHPPPFLPRAPARRRPSRRAPPPAAAPCSTWNTGRKAGRMSRRVPGPVVSSEARRRRAQSRNLAVIAALSFAQQYRSPRRPRRGADRSRNVQSARRLPRSCGPDARKFCSPHRPHRVHARHEQMHATTSRSEAPMFNAKHPRQRVGAG